MLQAEPPRSLGAAIKARRQELGWSQEELAERVAAHGDAVFRQSDVSRLERGKVDLPHRERLFHIAAVLDLSLGELLARSGWIGADVAFGKPAVPAMDPAPAAPVVVAPPEIPGARLLPQPSQISPPLRSRESNRLRELLAQSEATRARSKEILARSEALRVLSEQPLPARQRQG